MPNAIRDHTRRRFVKLGGLAGAAALAGCTSGIPGGDSGSNGDGGDESGSGEWPMFQYDAGNTGSAPVSDPGGEVGEVWSFDTDDSIVSPPVVRGDTVFFNTGEVRAISTDGEEKWSAGVDTKSVAVTGDYLLRATSTAFREDHDLYVHDMEDGVELAKYDVTGYRSSEIAVADGTVYVSSNPTFGTEEFIESLYALTPEDGIEWTFDVTPESAEGDGSGSEFRQLTPAVTNDTVLLATNLPDETGPEKLHAVAKSGGSEQWSTEIPDEPTAPISAADGTLYLPRQTENGTELHALSTDDGSERWSMRMDRPELSSAAVADGTVYVACDRRDAPDGSAVVRALSTDDGSETWTYETEENLVGPPVIVGDTVYASGTDRPFRERGDVYAIAASDGSERWHFETDRHVGTSPVIVDGRIYLGSKRDTVYAIS